jgi:tryptophan-rich sensory protein
MEETHNWYKRLHKPSWAPPSWIFAPVWTVLYIIIAITFGMVFYSLLEGQITLIIFLPFALNIIFNFAFRPIQFDLKNNYLATLDIFLTLTTLVWALIAIFPYIEWVTYANIPYLLWTSFATILQLTVTWLNR